ncbi:hypothetical protein J6590_057617 [Homalodisca vitripennis]|nr:hypothetical protein J6590_057617 [Homalodisca vitripennis]
MWQRNTSAYKVSERQSGWWKEDKLTAERPAGRAGATAGQLFLSAVNKTAYYVSVSVQLTFLKMAISAYCTPIILTQQHKQNKAFAFSSCRDYLKAMHLNKNEIKTNTDNRLREGKALRRPYMADLQLNANKGKQLIVSTLLPIRTIIVGDRGNVVPEGAAMLTGCGAAAL